jgi:hypothetical protein
MRITRRGAMIGAGGALALAAGAAGVSRGALAIYDSRILESLAFAHEARAGRLRVFDIGHEEAQLWRNARAGFGLAPGGDVVGLTRWSDWNVLRGALEAKGLRMRREVRLDCGGDGHACNVLSLIAEPGLARAVFPGEKMTLFAWSMR